MQIGARGRDGGIDEFILATMRISLLASCGGSDPHGAAKKGDAKRVQELLSNGGSPFRVDRTCNTALHYAAERCHTEVINILLESGANAFTPNNKGDTPVALAGRRGCDYLKQRLLLLERVMYSGVSTDSARSSSGHSRARGNPGGSPDSGSRRAPG